MAVAKKSSKPAATKTPSRPAPKAAPAAKKPKPAVKAGAVAKAQKPAKPEKLDKAKKPKLVRDSFTIPKAEYAVLEQLKQRAMQAGTPAKKSELLRAGIKALAGMTDSAFGAALGTVPAIKTGRPANPG